MPSAPVTSSRSRPARAGGAGCTPTRRPTARSRARRTARGSAGRSARACCRPRRAAGSRAGTTTFFTRPALATTEPVAAPSPVENRFHTSRPDSRQIGNDGDARLQDDRERDVEDDEVEQRVEQRPREPEDAVLVLDLQLLADHPDEQLAVLPDPSEALAEPRARPDDARRWGNCGWHTVHGSRPGRRKPCSGRSVAGSMTVRRLTNARPFPPLRSVLSSLRRNAALRSRRVSATGRCNRRSERASPIWSLVRARADRSRRCMRRDFAILQHGEDGLIAALLERIEFAVARSSRSVPPTERRTARARSPSGAGADTGSRPTVAGRRPPRSPATST